MPELYDPVVAPSGGIGERYATEFGALWSELAQTLDALERRAAEPQHLDEGDIDPLRVLQYGLHRASEEAFALAPPSGLEPVNSELASALESARDATAEIVDALEEDGADAVLALVYEWRGALFRVRLARLRLAGPVQPAAVDLPPARRELRAPLLACLLVACGGIAFAGGAVTGFWPIWVAGMLAVCGSFIAYKP